MITDILLSQESQAQSALWGLAGNGFGRPSGEGAEPRTVRVCTDRSMCTSLCLTVALPKGEPRVARVFKRSPEIYIFI